LTPSLATLVGLTVVELRQYTLRPGRRDELIDLFEAEFVEPQEDCGIRVVGTFRDLCDAQKFVWIRSFPDMERRAVSLSDFYGGPAWRRHREAANATMLDSDNVLLLRPAWDRAGFDVLLPPDSRPVKPGIVHVGIVPFAEPVTETDLEYFAAEVVPRLQASGARVLACLVSEHATNTFPALPVREAENVLVWWLGFPHLAAHRRGLAARGELDRATAAFSGAAGAVEILALAPTEGSLLTGRSTTEFTPLPLLGRSA
jgi:hypothetical protein